MNITKTSLISGKVHTMNLDVTQEQLDHWVQSGTVIQDAFPALSPDEREFLLSGCTPDEWDELFSEEE